MSVRSTTDYEATMRLIEGIARRRRLLTRMKTRLSKLEDARLDPIASYLDDADEALSKLVSRMLFLTCQVKPVTPLREIGSNIIQSFGSQESVHDGV
jgi:hypothetical protein